MRYTIRNVPADVDRDLRQRAREAGRSLNDLVLEAVRHWLACAESSPRRDLSDIVGTWQEDPATSAALRRQRRVDRDLWR